MLGDISKAEHIYIACGYTDMRKSIDGLAAIVQQNFKLDPFSNSLFLFCGRSSTKMKVLYWEGDGSLEVSHTALRLRINLNDHLRCLYHVGSVIHAAFLYVPVGFDLGHILYLHQKAFGMLKQGSLSG